MFVRISTICYHVGYYMKNEGDGESDWISIGIKIDDLYLDHSNPRFPDQYSNSSQSDLIHDLIEKEDIYGLAKKLTEGKEIPQFEKIFALKENDKYIVLEGNRRVATYKCLAYPELTPGAWKKKFQALADIVKYDGNKILDVIIAPSRRSASAIIKAKHTTAWIKSWDPRMQGSFVKRNLGESSQEKIKAVEAGFYEIIKNLGLPKDIQVKIESKKDFPITTLYRVVASRVGKELLKYETSTDGEIRIQNKSIFEGALKRIVNDIANGIINTRKGAKNMNEIRSYLSEVVGLNKSQPSPPSTQEKKTQDTSNILASVSPVKTTSLQPLPPPISKYSTRKYNDRQNTEIIRCILNRLPDVINQYKKQYKNTFNISIKNEYDVQYLLQGVLKLYFEDVRLEVPTGQVFDKSYRSDIFLFDHQIIIETKYVYKTTTEKVLGEEFMRDVVGFQQTYPGCKKIYFYVYNPNNILATKQTLISDVRRLDQQQKNITVEAIISP